ncbi:MAG: S8 family serine peptidase, partial [Bacteroidota bacterium]
ALPFVEYIQRAYFAENFGNDNLAIHRTSYLKRITSLNLNGDGVTVGVGDGGTINEHLDLQNRVLNAMEIDAEGHASLVNGIIAGEGIINPFVKGHAPKANIIANYYENIISEASEYIDDFNMSLANHSYGNIPDSIPFCDFSGVYDMYSQNIDQSTSDYPQLLHFVAAGNAGQNTCLNYPFGYNTIFNGIQTAKNVITVGSTAASNVISSFSSRGPTKDGRIKPEIVSIGEAVRSTLTQHNYATVTNTSFSTPSATGTAALLTQHYKNIHNDSLPEAALLKAILCNSADDLGNIGPDYLYGFGRVNAYKAAKIISNEQHLSDTISNGQTYAYNINVPSGTERLKVIICWSDLAASPLVSQSLINNLDMEIVAPDANLHYPWLLDTVATQVANPAFRGNASDRDSINNIEQITIENPMAGNYEIRVLGTMIPMGTQRFHIAYELAEKELVLTNPIGGEQLLPNDNLLITWEDTTGFQNDTLALFYSSDNGLNWNAIDTTILPNQTQYTFNLPSLTSNEMLVRIRNKDNTFADTSSTFSIMGRPTLTAIPNCDEAVELSWTSVSDATTYEVFQYNNGWQSIQTTASTSHTVSGLTLGEEYCFTVQAISASGVESSTAIGKCVPVFGNTVSSFPYQEDFENDNGNWTSRGKNNDWEWGVPSNTLINQAADGNKAWVTDLDSNYTDAGFGILHSPCFDLSNLTTPVLSFSMWKDIESDSASLFDFARIQYSTNGVNWATLGSNGTGYNWYNHRGGQNAWDGTDSCWHQVRYNIPTTASTLRFRLFLNSDPFVNQEGVGIDNIYIYDAAEDDHFVVLNAKIALQGAFNSSHNLMHDSLRIQGQIPLQQPYNDLLGYNGNEEITDLNILNITGSDAIVDWVLLELRSAEDASSVVATRVALVQRDGNVVDLDGVSSVQFKGVEANDFFVAVKYRNHLGVMTDAVVELANILIK